MPVDMVPKRFIEELNRPGIMGFTRYGKHDPVIQRASLPPKQAISTGLFLFCHDAGYRLPSWKEFRFFYLKAVLQNKYRSKFMFCFTDDNEPKPGLLWRMSGWYEDSIVHAFLNSVLAFAYEDLDQSAFVLYDARADWKLKSDFIVLRSGEGGACKAVGIDVQGQDDDERVGVEAERARRERVTKRNTRASSHENNQTYQSLRHVRISRAHGTPIIENGFRLFSYDAMNSLLTDVDTVLGQPRRTPMPVEDMLKCGPLR